ncbi:MAG: MBOAT family O-acyltransferase [Polyangiaceae bacterium]
MNLAAPIHFLLGGGGALPLRAIVVAFGGGLIASITPPAWRRGVLGVTGVLGAILIYGRATLGFAASCAIAYAVGKLLCLLANPRRRWDLSCVAMIIAALTFFIGRHRGWAQVHVSVSGYALIPFSLDMWLVLRIVSFFWEVGARRTEDVDLGSFTSWIALPFTFAGPLIRYAAFKKQLTTTATTSASALTTLRQMPWWRELGVALMHMAGGVIAAALMVGLPSTGSPLVHFAKKVGDIFVFAPWSFYLGVGGALRFFECAAVLAGVALPPSFDKPFQQRNLSEFWKRWNMTVTNMLRDYLFYNRWGFRTPNAYVNTLVLFVAVGLWHSTDFFWFTWGLLHGIGFCIFLWFHRRRGKPLLGPRLGKFLSIAVTYVFVCSCWAAPPKILLLAHHFLH